MLPDPSQAAEWAVTAHNVASVLRGRATLPGTKATRVEVPRASGNSEAIPEPDTARRPLTSAGNCAEGQEVLD